MCTMTKRTIMRICSSTAPTMKTTLRVRAFAFQLKCYRTILYRCSSSISSRRVMPRLVTHNSYRKDLIQMKSRTAFPSSDCCSSTTGSRRSISSIKTTPSILICNSHGSNQERTTSHLSVSPTNSRYSTISILILIPGGKSTPDLTRRTLRYLRAMRIWVK